MTARFHACQYTALANFVVHKHLRATLDGLGCNNKNFFPKYHKFRIAQLPDVGVEESANKVVLHEPFHLVLTSWP